MVDFCGGSGHLALVLGAALPTARVVIADFNAKSLSIARERAEQLGVKNVSTWAGDITK